MKELSHCRIETVEDEATDTRGGHGKAKGDAQRPLVATSLRRPGHDREAGDHERKA